MGLVLKSIHATKYQVSSRAFKDPIEAYDCEAKEEVLLRPFAFFFPGDNPMQAELCSCSGLTSNHFCRTCKVGGSQAYKQSEEGFAELFKVRVVVPLFTESLSHIDHRQGSLELVRRRPTTPSLD